MEWKHITRSNIGEPNIGEHYVAVDQPYRVIESYYYHCWVALYYHDMEDMMTYRGKYIGKNLSSIAFVPINTMYQFTSMLEAMAICERHNKLLVLL